MRILLCIALLAPLALAGCGGTTEKKTVVVTPPANSTVVVPDSSTVHVCQPGQTVC